MVSPSLSETTSIPTLVTGRSSRARMASICRFREGALAWLVIVSSVRAGGAASPAKEMAGDQAAIIRESAAAMILLKCVIRFPSERMARFCFETVLRICLLPTIGIDDCPQGADMVRCGATATTDDLHPGLKQLYHLFRH